MSILLQHITVNRLGGVKILSLKVDLVLKVLDIKNVLLFRRTYNKTNFWIAKIIVSKKLWSDIVEATMATFLISLCLAPQGDS